jgi:hypothetical protein
MKLFKQIFCRHIWETVSEKFLDIKRDCDTCSCDTFYRFLKIEKCAKCEKIRKQETFKLDYEISTESAGNSGMVA